MENSIKFDDQNNEDLSKIDLSSVEEVSLNNGKKYIKFIDLKNNVPVMLDITNNNMSVKEIIESIQLGSYSFNTTDALYNTSGILGMEQKYSKHELRVVPVEQIERIRHIIPQDKLQTVNLFEKNKDRFNPKIKYVVVDEGLAIDEDNNVIVSYYNKENNRYDVRYADTTKYEVENKEVNTSYKYSIDNIDIDGVIDSILVDNKPVFVSGYKVDIDRLIQYSNYPELLDRNNMNDFERMLWKKLIDIYLKKKNKQNSLEDSPKVKVKNNKNNNVKPNAFASEGLNIFVSGVTVGVVVSFIIYLVIKVLFR